MIQGIPCQNCCSLSTAAGSMSRPDMIHVKSDEDDRTEDEQRASYGISSRAGHEKDKPEHEVWSVVPAAPSSSQRSFARGLLSRRSICGINARCRGLVDTGFLVECLACVTTMFVCFVLRPNEGIRVFCSNRTSLSNLKVAPHPIPAPAPLQVVKF